jgi:hypothetical protein
VEDLNLEIIVIALGLIASASFITMNYVINRNLVLYAQTIALTSLVLQFSIKAIIESNPILFGVVLVNAIFLLRNFILYYLDVKSRKITSPDSFLTSRRLIIAKVFMPITILLYIIVTPLPQNIDLLSLGLFLLPLFAAIVGIVAMSTISIIKIKSFLWLSTLSWVLYNTLQFNWQNLIGDIFSLIAGTIAIFRIIKSRQK